jgi:hypothetical protein
MEIGEITGWSYSNGNRCSVPPPLLFVQSGRQGRFVSDSLVRKYSA